MDLMDGIRVKLRAGLYQADNRFGTRGSVIQAENGISSVSLGISRTA